MNSFDVKGLIEERAMICKELQAMASKVKAEGKEFTPEENEQFDKLDAKQEELRTKIDTASRVEKSERFNVADTNVSSAAKHAFREKSLTRQDQNNILAAHILRKAGENIPQEYMSSVNKANYDINGSLSIDTREQNTGTNNVGGYSLNGAIVQGFDKVLVSFGQLRSACTVLNTANGSPLVWLTADDHSNVSALKTQNVTVTNTDHNFGVVTFNSYTLQSGVFPVSRELLTDHSNQVDLIGIISDALATRYYRKENAYCTTGTGSSQPKGIVACAAASGITTASTSAVTYGELVDTMYSVDAGYINSPKCGWMMTRATLGAIRKLTDSQGRPLWTPNVIAGQPDMLLGYPVYYNQDMAGLTAAAKPILFGDFSKFYIRNVGSLDLRILQERWADLNAIGCQVIGRVDSNSINAGAFNYLLMHA